MWQVYKMTAAADPSTPWWVLGTFFGTIAVGVVIGILMQWVIFFTLTGVMVGLLLAMVVLGRKAQRAAYTQVRGKSGIGMAALMSLGRGWNVKQQPVAMDAGNLRRPPKTAAEMSRAAVVYRAIGRPGVVLTAEGPTAAASRLLESERRRIARVVGDEVPVHTYRIGSGDGEVDIAALPKHVKKLKKALTDAEVSAVAKRLDSLGGMQQKAPAGMDPTRVVRGSRRAVRGR